MIKPTLIGVLLVSLAMNAPAQGPNSTNATQPSSDNIPPPHLCSGENFPIAKGGSPSCCRQGDDIYQVVLHPGDPSNPQSLGHRQTGAFCTTKTGSNKCIGTQCDYGPCGATLSYKGTSTTIPGTLDGTKVVVFRPKTGPDKCGYEVMKDPGNQVVASFPQLFVDQDIYPAVVPSCPYTACLGDGRRAVIFTINAVVTGSATGTTSADPGNVTLNGAGNKTLAREQEGDVTVTAAPASSQVKASFSGACTNSGQLGQTIQCTIPFAAPNPTVTVTYQ